MRHSPVILLTFLTILTLSSCDSASDHETASYVSICDSLTLENEFVLLFCDTVRRMCYIQGDGKVVDELKPAVAIKIKNHDEISVLIGATTCFEFVESIYHTKYRADRPETLSLAYRGCSSGVGPGLIIAIFKRDTGKGPWSMVHNLSTLIRGPLLGTQVISWKNNFAFSATQPRAKHKDTSYYGIVGRDFVELQYQQLNRLQSYGAVVYQK